jgi:integrase
MAPTHSTKKTKPAKPYSQFPLHAAHNGQWGKTIRGRVVYFGVWDDPEAALALYHQERNDWENGRNPRTAPRPQTDTITVGQMVALMLDAKESLVATQEISPRTYEEYALIGQRLKRVFGAGTPVASLGPADFARLKEDFVNGHPIAPRTPRQRKRTSKGHQSLRSLRGDVRKVRVFINFARDGGYLSRPPCYGVFQVPTKKALRLERKRKPKRLLSAAQIHALLAVATVPVRAMLYLGINCAFGNNDCAALVRKELDLEGGWATFQREKTGLGRRCPLWPETIAALRTALDARPAARDPALEPRVFLTHHGRAWSQCTLSDEFDRLRGRSAVPLGSQTFYTLRHTFVTVARKQTRDADAIRMITGHVTDEDDMLTSVYDEDWNDVEDQRIKAVGEGVRQWLMSGCGGSAGTPEEAADVLPLSRQRA